jgi:hypothetical protein
MQTALPNEMLERSEILADALDETIAELRLIDAGDMITYIRAGQWANISDLVQSSAELSFEDGAVSFAYAGDYAISWGEAPSIALDMEFQTSELTAFFTLTIGPSESAVRIKNVMFTTAPADQEAATRAFAHALAAARRDTKAPRREKDKER